MYVYKKGNFSRIFAILVEIQKVKFWEKSPCKGPKILKVFAISSNFGPILKNLVAHTRHPANLVPPGNNLTTGKFNFLSKRPNYN